MAIFQKLTGLRTLRLASEDGLAKTLLVLPLVAVKAPQCACKF